MIFVAFVFSQPFNNLCFSQPCLRREVIILDYLHLNFIKPQNSSFSPNHSDLSLFASFKALFPLSTLPLLPNTDSMTLFFLFNIYLITEISPTFSSFDHRFQRNHFQRSKFNSDFTCRTPIQFRTFPPGCFHAPEKLTSGSKLLVFFSKHNDIPEFRSLRSCASV